MLDTRAATVSALRARIAALSGDHAGPRPAAREQPGIEARAAALGFVPERTPQGTRWVRRVTIDLTPALGSAGLGAPPAVVDLLSLLGHPSGDGAPTWLSGEGVGVLDIESLGLHGSGVMAFLVAVGVQYDAELRAEQFLLVDPGEEAALLAGIGEHIAAHRLWLTYNGRSFDIPVLAARCTLNRLPPSTVEPRVHGDLLGPVRRLFRDRLGPCTLRHAEMSLLSHHRVDDVPGAEAPARYRAWLRGAPASVLAGVVEHNLQDIVSTAVLGARLAAHVSGDPLRPAHPADAYHLGRHLERRGVADAAELELRAAITSGVEPWARQATHRLALALQRRGEMEEATLLWQRLHDSDERDLPAARGLAIRLERAGRLSEAVEVCVRVRRVRAEMGSWWQRLRGASTASGGEWDRREARLRRRVHS